MAKQREQHWRLYVDESGGFADAEDCATVAGLLISDTIEGGRPEQLRAALHRAMPQFSWPLHASVLNQPSYIALAWYAQSSAGEHPLSERDATADLARHVVARMSERVPEAVRATLSQIAAGREPDYALLVLLTDCLRRELPAECRQLDGLVEEAWTHVGDLAASLGRASSVPGGLPGAWLLTAAETEPGDALPGDGPQATDARYFTLLECLVERAARLLVRSRSVHRIGVHVLTRDVFETVLGRLVPLRIDHLGPVVHRAVNGLQNRVRVVPEIAGRFNQEVGGALVVVDFLANYSRRVLRNAHDSLSVVEGRLHGRFGLPVRSGEPALSHLAASGEARRFIVSCTDVAGLTETIMTGGRRRRWACEQAAEWAQAVRR